MRVFALLSYWENNLLWLLAINQCVILCGSQRLPCFPWAGSKLHLYWVDNQFSTSPPPQIKWIWRGHARKEKVGFCIGGWRVSPCYCPAPLPCLGPGASSEYQRKNGLRMPVKHLWSKALSSFSRFLTHCRNLIMNSFHLSGERADERHRSNCISVSWTYLKQTAGRLLSFLSLKVETIANNNFFLSIQTTNVS